MLKKPCSKQNVFFKINMLIALSLYLIPTAAYGSLNTKNDSIKALAFIKRAKIHYDSAQYDSSIIYYQLAAKAYKKERNWEKHIRCLNEVISVKRKQGKEIELLE